MITLIAALTFTACTDEIDYKRFVVGEGEAVISASIEYEPNISSLDMPTRAAGNAIGEINDLSIVIYSSKKELLKIYSSLSDDESKQLLLSHSINVEKPSDYVPGMDVAEDTTARVTFTLPEALPFGRYYMYCVANLGKAVTEEMAATEETLKGQTVTWQFGDVSKNAQMFGYMTADDNRTSSGFDAPLLIVNKANTTLHSWIKRLASKVTVAFDGSGLHQNIWVYVHNVSIRQIPLSCKLGENNTPDSKDAVSPDGYQADHGYIPAGELPREQFLIYNDSMIVESDKYPKEEDYKHWLTVANGSGVKGSKNHTKNDPALYFYENMQGDYADRPDKDKFDKVQNPDKVGENVTPDMDDYKDNVPYGTFVEVEAYYVSNNVGNISNGPIKYRFMLGQNTSFNYDAIRNHHYKLTLCFKGYANQPDWHIEYYEETPDMFVPEVYLPYLYNSSVDYPLRFNGNLIALDLEIIENNWAPYDETSFDEVPPETLGNDDFENRVLQFNWNKTVYMNGDGSQQCPPANQAAQYKGPGGVDVETTTYASNYLYGRHITDFKYLEGDKKGHNYKVTPIWVGFLRLQQPKAYESESVALPMNIFADDASWFYYNPRYQGEKDVRGGMKKYYEGKGGTGKWTNGDTNLGKRTFEEADLTPGSHGTGRNSYTVERSTYQGENTTTVNFKLWTQPKTMGYISGFSGNNPYETYPRKAVVRVTAKFKVETGTETKERTLIKDVPIIQGRRLINPKGIWRSSTDNDGFDFVLLERRKAGDINFTPLRSIGEWSASVAQGSGVTLSPMGGSRPSSKYAGGVEGDTDSEVRFKVNFSGGNNCAIVEVRYHGNSCVHKVFCRQGYDVPLAIVDGGAKWSSYSVFSCDPNFTFGKQDDRVSADLTVNPLALGTMYKKGNYREGIKVSNAVKYPVRQPLDGGLLELTNNVASKAWGDIIGIARSTVIKGNIPSASTNAKTTLIYDVYDAQGKVIRTDTTEFNAQTWKWAKFAGKNHVGAIKNYRVASYQDYADLMSKGDVGVGVLYGDGATSPQTQTKEAFGFFDTTNEQVTSTQGMRGFFCYNKTNGNNLFFPIGTTGMGRRLMQGLRTDGTEDGWKRWAGVLRYSAVNMLLTQGYTTLNQFRPIPYNMPSAPGAIYWIEGEANVAGWMAGWDMNFFDMNFYGYDYAMSIGPYGDAVPIKLVLE